MSYAIGPGRPLAVEVASVAEEQYRKAIESLRDQPKGRDRAIHDARKRFKRLRGVFRLVRGGAPEVCARENARIRDIAKTLSAVRDATALVEALDRLIAEDCAKKGEAAALRKVRKRLAARRDRIAAGETRIDERIAAAIASCEAGIEALDELKLPDDGGEAIALLAGGAADNYRRAVDALARARKSGDAEDWHDLRKRIKYHWMHMLLLRPAWPGVMEARAAVADIAGEALGEDHDLAVLAALAKAEPETLGDARELAVLRAVMRRGSRRLHKRIAEIVEPLLRDDADLVRDRMAALLTAAGSNAT